MSELVQPKYTDEPALPIGQVIKQGLPPLPRRSQAEIDLDRNAPRFGEPKVEVKEDTEAIALAECSRILNGLTPRQRNSVLSVILKDAKEDLAARQRKAKTELQNIESSGATLNNLLLALTE